LISASEQDSNVFQILGGSGSARDVADPTTVLDIVGYPGAPEGDADAHLKPDTLHTTFAQGCPRPTGGRSSPASDRSRRSPRP